MADDTAITDPGLEDPEAGADAPEDPGAGDAPDSADLGDAGKRALTEERKARKEAEKARKALEAELEELRAASQRTGDEDAAKAEADRIRREAEQAATAKANERILSAEIRAAAAGKLADPSDALRYLNMTDFDVAEDGGVDQEEIADAISDLLKRKPYLAARAQGFQGTGDGGSRTNGSGPRQVTETELKTMSPEQISQARRDGRLKNLL